MKRSKRRKKMEEIEFIWVGEREMLWRERQQRFEWLALLSFVRSSDKKMDG